MIRISPLRGDKVSIYPMHYLRDVSRDYRELKELIYNIEYDEELKKSLHDGAAFLVLLTDNGEPKFFFESKGWFQVQQISPRNITYSFVEDEDTNNLVIYVKYEMVVGKKGVYFNKLQKELFYRFGEVEIDTKKAFSYYEQ